MVALAQEMQVQIGWTLVESSVACSGHVVVYVCTASVLQLVRPLPAAIAQPAHKSASRQKHLGCVLQTSATNRQKIHAVKYMRLLLQTTLSSLVSSQKTFLQCVVVADICKSRRKSANRPKHVFLP